MYFTVKNSYRCWDYRFLFEDIFDLQSSSVEVNGKLRNQNSIGSSILKTTNDSNNFNK